MDEDRRVARVREAYERLMTAFANAETETYFGCFHEDATFFFPDEPLVGSLEAYRSLWSTWEAEGVRFVDVVTEDVRIQVVGATAVVTHRIDTTVSTPDSTSVDHERETLVFSEIDGRWLGVHEHLSPDVSPTG